MTKKETDRKKPLSLPRLRVAEKKLEKEKKKANDERRELKREMSKLNDQVSILNRQVKKCDNELKAITMVTKCLPDGAKPLSEKKRIRDNDYALTVGLLKTSKARVIITRPHRHQLTHVRGDVYDVIMPSFLLIFNTTTAEANMYPNGQAYGWCRLCTPDAYGILELKYAEAFDVKEVQFKLCDVPGITSGGRSDLCKIPFRDIPKEERSTEKAQIECTGRYLNSVMSTGGCHESTVEQWSKLSDYLPATQSTILTLAKTDILPDAGNRYGYTPDRLMHANHADWDSRELHQLLKERSEVVKDFLASSVEGVAEKKAKKVATKT